MLTTSARQSRPHRPPSGAPRPAEPGERVVTGQPLVQALGDIFLGWQRTAEPDGVEHDCYARPLRDGSGV